MFRMHIIKPTQPQGQAQRMQNPHSQLQPQPPQRPGMITRVTTANATCGSCGK